ncbi:hypothetical protein [Chryseobacterium oryctis]|uniref:Uncharacterized protein n=1 Tax=Chryseobacterium oryctis TaxID=2952618 RepID=A0ABT3HP61_9FLAO|nr:hypothetical protein [Chryseobacterium oryctis]MCW3161574.1 hypothetical protein [Chryseobacterium oryctis]
MSLNNIAYYEFAFCNSPLTVGLQEKKNNRFSGSIYVHLEKKKNNNIKEINRNKKIPPKQAKRIISKLKELEIDLVNENYDDDSLVYLDGDYLTIKILRKGNLEKLSFDEIYPESKLKIEKTPLRSKIQNWLTIIDDELNLREQYSKIKYKLNKGTYCYDSGIRSVCFEKIKPTKKSKQ